LAARPVKGYAYLFYSGASFYIDILCDPGPPLEGRDTYFIWLLSFS
jgi:hypothetical protein